MLVSFTGKKAKKDRVIYSIYWSYPRYGYVKKGYRKKGSSQNMTTKRISAPKGNAHRSGERIVGLCHKDRQAGRNASFQCGRGGYQAMYKIAEGH